MYQNNQTMMDAPDKAYTENGVKGLKTQPCPTNDSEYSRELQMLRTTTDKLSKTVSELLSRLQPVIINREEKPLSNACPNTPAPPCFSDIGLDIRSISYTTDIQITRLQYIIDLLAI